MGCPEAEGERKLRLKFEFSGGWSYRQISPTGVDFGRFEKVVLGCDKRS